ncbi:MAG: elongation factor P--(R)-beta-lysine ligase [Legionella sp.]|nr:elongation factor P--(R)-beta-lysine ligase [Legionella sp.]
MSSELNWMPSASINTLRARAKFMAEIRAFFTKRDYLEVETPVMSAFGVTDVYLESIAVQCLNQQYYLQTSPEYHMKRLLAAGSGPIFQLSRAFRDDELGRWHNPEFTMLEWYRPDINHHAMLKEVDALLHQILKTKPLLIKTYQEVFELICDFDPFNISLLDLKKKLFEFNLDNILSSDEQDIDQYLFLLMSYVIEPELAKYDTPVALINFPASQAALACVHDGVAERFEVYYQGIELANGFHELTDAKLQAERFALDNKKREAKDLQVHVVDTRFLAAMTYGLPQSTGVALGVDRLFALMLRFDNIQSGLAFDVSRA